MLDEGNMTNATRGGQKVKSKRAKGKSKSRSRKWGRLPEQGFLARGAL
jgi:hypothetical protein